MQRTQEELEDEENLMKQFGLKNFDREHSAEVEQMIQESLINNVNIPTQQDIKNLLNMKLDYTG